eukprot:766329-Hanusia_phi.AAC.4
MRLRTFIINIHHQHITSHVHSSRMFVRTYKSCLLKLYLIEGESGEPSGGVFWYLNPKHQLFVGESKGSSQ